jgi:signal recognition particle GTPase
MEGNMTEETGDVKSISGELTRLGKQVADAINKAWESEDRKKLQAEVTTGLESFGTQVSDAMRKASESEAANQIRDQTEKVVTQVRESDVTAEVRKGLISGLEVLNRELGRLVERLEVPAQAPESAAAEPPETSEPAEPSAGA